MSRLQSPNSGFLPPYVDITPFSKLKHLRKIGEGGFGEVYRAKHIDWSEVAYKKLLVQFINQNDRAANEMKNEIQTHIQLRHPNIITLMGVVFEPSNYGVILEYAPHGDLWNFMKAYKPVKWAWKLQLSYEVCLGVNYLHALPDRALIHGDLKTKNVLIGDGFRAKVSDFGLSKWKLYSFEMTGRGGGGTVTHIPPENWNNINERRTEKYDSYSFAVLLWEMFSEKVPFSGCSVAKIKDLVVSSRRPSTSLLLNNVPDYVREIINQCWAQEPSDRPLFHTVKDRLERLCRQTGDLIHEAQRDLQTKEYKKQTRYAGAGADVYVKTRTGGAFPVQDNFFTDSHPPSVEDNDDDTSDDVATTREPASTARYQTAAAAAGPHWTNVGPVEDHWPDADRGLTIDLAATQHQVTPADAVGYPLQVVDNSRTYSTSLTQEFDNMQLALHSRPGDSGSTPVSSANSQHVPVQQSTQAAVEMDTGDSDDLLMEDTADQLQSLTPEQINALLDVSDT